MQTTHIRFSLALPAPDTLHGLSSLCQRCRRQWRHQNKTKKKSPEDTNTFLCSRHESVEEDERLQNHSGSRKEGVRWAIYYQVIKLIQMSKAWYLALLRKLQTYSFLDVCCQNVALFRYYTLTSNRTMTFQSWMLADTRINIKYQYQLAHPKMYCMLTSN